MIKVSEDSMKKGAITVRKYCDDHKCEKSLGPQGAQPLFLLNLSLMSSGITKRWVCKHLLQKFIGNSICPK
jgi:hypothetical protein